MQNALELDAVLPCGDALCGDALLLVQILGLLGGVCVPCEDGGITLEWGFGFLLLTFIFFYFQAAACPRNQHQANQQMTRQALVV